MQEATGHFGWTIYDSYTLMACGLSARLVHHLCALLVLLCSASGL